MMKLIFQQDGISRELLPSFCVFADRCSFAQFIEQLKRGLAMIEELGDEQGWIRIISPPGRTLGQTTVLGWREEE
jgi:hypothetical protein